MKYLKLFEELTISKRDFPHGSGRDLYEREKSILKSIVGDNYLHNFVLKIEDGYYYTDLFGSYNEFDNFNDFRDYIYLRYYMNRDNVNEISNLVKNTKLDLSFDDNDLLSFCINHDYRDVVKDILKKVKDVSNVEGIYVATQIGDLEMLKILLEDGRMDPSDSLDIAVSSGDIDLVKMLLSDKRVRGDYKSLFKALEIRNAQILGMLLPTSIVHDKVEVLETAMEGLPKTKEIVELLLNDPEVRESLTEEEIEEYEAEIS